MAKRSPISRRCIQNLITEGHLIVILDQKVLRLDSWVERHPGIRPNPFLDYYPLYAIGYIIEIAKDFRVPLLISRSKQEENYPFFTWLAKTLMIRSMCMYFF